MSDRYYLGLEKFFTEPFRGFCPSDKHGLRGIKFVEDVKDIVFKSQSAEIAKVVKIRQKSEDIKPIKRMNERVHHCRNSAGKEV